eukprot:g537.t1
MYPDCTDPLHLSVIRDQQPLNDPKRVEQVLKESAKIGAVNSGVFDYFGKGQTPHQKLKDFDSVGFSLLIHSFGCLLKKCAIKAEDHLDLFNALLNEIISPERLTAFDHLSYAQILNGIVPFKNVKPHLIDMIVQEICKEELLCKIDAKTVSSILNSLAKLQYGGKQQIFKICHQAVLLRKWMRDQELANAFWSFGILQFKDFFQLDLFSAEMIHPKILSAFAPQALANILISCARLNYKNEKLLPCLLKEIILPFRLEAYDEQHLANITLALGKLQIRDKSTLNALAQSCITESRIQNFSALQICNIYTGWAYNSYSNKEAYHVLLHKIMDPSQGITKELTPQLLARLAWALSKLENTTEQDFKDLMNLISSKKHIQKYNNQDISNIFFACGKRKFSGRKALVPLLENVISLRRLEEYNDQQLANITWSLGEMGVREERVFRLLARSIIQSNNIFRKLPQLLMVLNGWAHGDFRYEEGLLKIKEELLRPHTLNGLLPKDIKEAFMVFKESQVSLMLFLVKTHWFPT